MIASGWLFKKKLLILYVSLLYKFKS